MKLQVIKYDNESYFATYQCKCTNLNLTGNPPHIGTIGSFVFSYIHRENPENGQSRNKFTIQFKMHRVGEIELERARGRVVKASDS